MKELQVITETTSILDGAKNIVVNIQNNNLPTTRDKLNALQGEELPYKGKNYKIVGVGLYESGNEVEHSLVEFLIKEIVDEK